MKWSRLLGVATVGLGCLLIGVAPAFATFPGRAGKIVFRHGGLGRAAPNGIYTINPDGTGLRRLAATGRLRSPSWSPDSRSIVFSNDLAGPLATLFRMNANGAKKRKIASDYYANHWLADGRIVLDRSFWVPGDQRASVELSVVDPTGGSRTTLFVRSATHEFTASQWLDFNLYGTAWSPDGRTTAFLGAECTPDAGPGIDPCIRGGIYMQSRDGSGLRLAVSNLPSVGGVPGVGDLDWSPNGRQFVADTGAQRGSIYVVNIDGSGSRKLTNGYTPAWSPDGRRIVFARPAQGASRLYVVNADGGGERLLLGGRHRFWREPSWGSAPPQKKRHKHRPRKS